MDGTKNTTRGRIALADCRISDKIEVALSEYAENIIKLPAFSRLAPPVASHPDMLIFSFRGKLFTWEEYYNRNASLFQRIKSLGFETVCIRECADTAYPHDVRLNCVLMENKLIANTRTVSTDITEAANKEGLRLIHVNQGYTKCSVAAVSENALITADTSIERAARQHGIDVLKISEGHVELEGYNMGFIGGASGLYRDKLLFCGQLSAHPDFEKITDFCEKHGKTPVSLSDTPLYDYGTIIIPD